MVLAKGHLRFFFVCDFIIQYNREWSENGKGKRKDERDCCGQFSKLFPHFGRRLNDIYNSFISHRLFDHMIFHINEYANLGPFC